MIKSAIIAAAALAAATGSPLMAADAPERPHWLDASAFKRFADHPE